MRTKFRYAALLLAVTAGTGLTVVSCSSDSTAPAAATELRVAAAKLDNLRDNYGWMGDYHTKALELAFATLSEPKNRGLSRVDKCRVASAALKEFHKSFRRNGRPLGFTDVSTIDGLCEAGAKGDLKVAAAVAASVAAAPGKVRNDISAAASKHMTQIELAFDSDVSRSALESRVNDIQSSASASLRTDEAGAVVGLGSIAFSSISYWDANEDAWTSGGTGGGAAYSRSASAGPSLNVGVSSLAPRFGFGPRSRAIMKADVSAALSTLIYEWFLGTIALEKAVLRGAAASMLAALMM